MTVHDQRASARTPTIPSPRTAVEDPERVDPQATDTSPAGEFPWPEPWHFSRGARPRTEFWDVETATWRSRGPNPVPRSGE